MVTGEEVPFLVTCKQWGVAMGATEISPHLLSVRQYLPLQVFHHHNLPHCNLNEAEEFYSMHVNMSLYACALNDISGSMRVEALFKDQ